MFIVVGDSCIPGDMPKSGFSANSQAKVAAMMIRGELANGRTFPARYTNTCWSLIETDDTVKVGGSYAAKDGKIAATETFVSKTGETAELRKQTQVENNRVVCRHRRRHFHLVRNRRLLRLSPCGRGLSQRNPTTMVWVRVSRRPPLTHQSFVRRSRCPLPQGERHNNAGLPAAALEHFGAAV